MRKLISLLILLLCLTDFCLAQSNERSTQERSIVQQDVAVFTQIARSKYFNIFSQKELDFLKLIRRLDLRSEYLLLRNISYAEEPIEDMLGAIVDAIFLEASDVLHMYLYSFKGNIKLCQNQQELNKIFRDLFDRDSRTHSFYAHNTNSIYVNMQNIRLEDLAYEVARAIISHYFAVLPPAEVQETLAKDAGYQIKKLAK